MAVRCSQLAAAARARSVAHEVVRLCQRAARPQVALFTHLSTLHGGQSTSLAAHVLLQNRVPSVKFLRDCCRHHNKLADALSNEALDGVGWDGGLKLPNVSSSQI
jgi:hypothetical protein